MIDNRNTILAVILSGLVLIAWQYFYNVPQMERQRAQSQVQAELAKKAQTPAPSSAAPSAPPQPGGAPTSSSPSPTAVSPASTGPVVDRDAAIEATPRVKINSPR